MYAIEKYVNNRAYALELTILESVELGFLAKWKKKYIIIINFLVFQNFEGWLFDNMENASRINSENSWNS